MNLMRFMNAERWERVLCGSGFAISRKSKSGIFAIRATPFLTGVSVRNYTKLTRNLHVVKEHGAINGRPVEILGDKSTPKVITEL